jgi:hypothetical protein
LTLNILDILVPSSFFLLSLLQLLLVLLFATSYPDSQFTFRKHVYPQQFGDDNLSPPELCLTRMAQWPNQDTILVSAWKTEKNHKKPVGIVNVLANIYTKNLSKYKS